MDLPLTPLQIAITIGMCVLGTMITRFTTFLLLSRKAEPPAIVAFLGRVLPPAVMGFLLVYSLKDIAFGGEDMRDAYLTLSGSGRLVKTRWPRPGLKLQY